MSSKTSSLAISPVLSRPEGPIAVFQLPSLLTAALGAPSPQLSVSLLSPVFDTARTVQADAGTPTSSIQTLTLTLAAS